MQGDQRLIQQMLDDPEHPLEQRHVERAVCPQCRGEGTSSLYLGAFTASEFDEMGEEFQYDYMRGALDRTCETCDGLRVVWELRDDAPTEAHTDMKEHWETEAIYEMERRMGA